MHKIGFKLRDILYLYIYENQNIEMLKYLCDNGGFIRFDYALEIINKRYYDRLVKILSIVFSKHQHIECNNQIQEDVSFIDEYDEINKLITNI